MRIQRYEELAAAKARVLRAQAAVVENVARLTRDAGEYCKPCGDADRLDAKAEHLRLRATMLTAVVL